MIKVGLISLGCAKNLIDSEVMIGHLRVAHMAITPKAEEADVLIINTCSFIDQAKKESIEAIHEAVDGRRAGQGRRRQKIIVAGCLAQRFSKELPRLMPEVDAFIGLDQITQVAPIIEKLLAGEPDSPAANLVTKRPVFIPDYDTPRYRLTPRHYSYVKIAEGCNHPCTFCVIPQIRGRHRSRTVESIVREVSRLVEEGVREFNLISQDTTFFGMDRWEGDRPTPRSGVDSAKGDSLSTLLRALDAIPGRFWLRLLYTHPAHWSDELIETMAACPKVVRYVDMPLQHISDPMLEAMRRETDSAHIRGLLHRLRAGLPGLAVRTTFIVGFPGETEKDFHTLLDFIEEARFERAGVFRYSREEGTRAASLPGQVHHKTRESRWHQAMALLQRLHEENNRLSIGQPMEVLVEQPGRARGPHDAPDIDSLVFVDPSLPVGEFAQVTVQDVRGYDLVAMAG